MSGDEPDRPPEPDPTAEPSPIDRVRLPAERIQRTVSSGIRTGHRTVAYGIKTSVRPLYRPGVLYGALVLIVLSLLALITVPSLVQREIEALHDELDLVADPAAQQVEELRFYLAREMASARGYALSGDPSMLARFRAMRDSAEAVLARLPEKARRISSPVAEQAGAAATRVRAWHDALSIETMERLPVAPVRPSDPFERDEYEEALLALDSVDVAIGNAASERRARIRRAERLQIQATVVLGLLALVSAGLVTWLVTRVRRLARQAERERARSIRAAQARDRLIRGVSHDLKNPLAVIDGYAELLEMGLKGELTPDQRQTVGRIRATVAALLTTVQELVDLSSAQAGLLRIERETFRIGPLLRELTADYESVAETDGLRLRLEPIDDLPAVHGDRRRTRQILENLLGNAVKYTPHGGSILLSAEERTDGPVSHASHWLVVHVADTGPGIPLERQEMVFEEFVRLENAAGTTGSGVGLAMARSLAQLMGGTITLDSEPGVGSVFSLWLPLRKED